MAKDNMGENKKVMWAYQFSHPLSSPFPHSLHFISEYEKSCWDLTVKIPGTNPWNSNSVSMAWESTYSTCARGELNIWTSLEPSTWPLWVAWYFCHQPLPCHNRDQTTLPFKVSVTVAVSNQGKNKEDDRLCKELLIVSGNMQILRVSWVGKRN